MECKCRARVSRYVVDGVNHLQIDIMVLIFYLFTNLLQRLLATGKRNGIGISTRRRKISRGMSGSMCDGSMITATGGMGGQERHLQ